MVPPKGDSSVVKTNPDPTQAVLERLELLERTINDKFEIRDGATTLARGELKDTLAALLNAVNDKFSANEKLVSQLATATKDLVDQLAKANAVALAAALSTQKESAAKFELNVGELLKGLASNFATEIKATNDKIEVLRTMVTALTSRLDLGQGGTASSDKNRYDLREDTRDTKKNTTDNRTFVVAVIGAAIAAVALFIASGFHK
jgi:hypothetical protein